MFCGEKFEFTTELFCTARCWKRASIFRVMADTAVVRNGRHSGSGAARERVSSQRIFWVLKTALNSRGRLGGTSAPQDVNGVARGCES
jgi:hypothetical protein